MEQRSHKHVWAALGVAYARSGRHTRTTHPTREAPTVISEIAPSSLLNPFTLRSLGLGLVRPVAGASRLRYRQREPSIDPVSRRNVRLSFRLRASGVSGAVREDFDSVAEAVAGMESHVSLEGVSFSP